MRARRAGEAMTGRGWGVAVGLVILNALLVPTAVRGEPTDAGHKVTVVFRYDDFSATSPLWLEKAIFEEFAKRKLCLTVGVIPFVHSEGRNVPLDVGHVNTLVRYVRSGTIEVGLHGCSHRGASQYEPSEFAGVSYPRQLELIRRGKDELTRLVGVAPKTFIPPYNSYDANTLRAARAVGMQHFSAAFGGPVGSGFAWLPQTVEMREARDAVRKAQRFAFGDPYVVIVVHAFDFKEISPTRGVATIPEFRAFLAELAGRADVRVADIASAAEGNNLSASTYAANLRFAGRPDLLPAALSAGSGRMYFPLDGLHRAARRERMLTALFYAGVFAGAMVICVLGKLVVERIGPRRCWIWGGAALVVLSVLAAGGHPIGYRRPAFAVFVAGAYVGGLVAIARSRRVESRPKDAPAEIAEVGQ